MQYNVLVSHLQSQAQLGTMLASHSAGLGDCWRLQGCYLVLRPAASCCLGELGQAC